MFKPKKNLDPAENSKKAKLLGDAQREQVKLDYELKKQDVLSRSRPIYEDIRLNDIGRLKAQVLYQPSFDTNYLWDIREKEENGIKYYELYENVLESITVIAPGYKKLEIDSSEISHLLNSIYSTRLSLQIIPMSGHGLDGTLYGFSIYENFYRTIRISYWEKPQDDLKELDEVLKKYITIFKGIKNKINFA